MLQSHHNNNRGNSPGGAALSRSNSTLSFLSIKTLGGETPPGHYVVVYDTLEKRIHMESPESVESPSDTVCDLPFTNGE